jgi:hypothetical protein
MGLGFGDHDRAEGGAEEITKRQSYFFVAGLWFRTAVDVNLLYSRKKPPSHAASLGVVIDFLVSFFFLDVPRLFDLGSNYPLKSSSLLFLNDSNLPLYELPCQPSEDSKSLKKIRQITSEKESQTTPHLLWCKSLISP